MRAGGFGEGGGAAGGGMPSPGSPGGPGMSGGGSGGATRDTWQPLGSTGAVSSQGGYGMGMGGGPGEMMTGPGGTASTATTMGAKSNHTRTEFVIFFIWKEPTPSDAMRATEGDATAASPADATGGGAGLTSTGPGKGAPRGVIDPVKKTTIGRPRGDAPGNRPYLNQPAATPAPQ